MKRVSIIFNYIFSLILVCIFSFLIGCNEKTNDDGNNQQAIAELKTKCEEQVTFEENISKDITFQNSITIDNTVITLVYSSSNKDVRGILKILLICSSVSILGVTSPLSHLDTALSE